MRRIIYDAHDTLERAESRDRSRISASAGRGFAAANKIRDYQSDFQSLMMD
jgi:hypothetical protein